MKKIIFSMFLVAVLWGGYLFWSHSESLDNTEDLNSGEIKKATEEEKIDKIPQLNEEEVIKNSSISELINRGDEYYNLGYLTPAINNYAVATAKDSSSTIAWQKLITAETELNDYEAAEISTQAAFAGTGDEIFKVLLGKIYLHTSDIESAKLSFADTKNEDAKNFYLGIIAAYEGEYETAKKYLASTGGEYAQQAKVMMVAFDEFSLFPDGSSEHLKLLIARSLNELGLFELAINKSKEIVSSRNEYRDAWLILGHSYLAIDKYSYAVKTLEDAYNLDPSKADTAYFLGEAEYRIEDYENAIIHLQMAKKNGYKPLSVVMNTLAKVYLEARYYDKARKEYELILNENPKSAEEYVKPIEISIIYLNEPGYAKRLAREALAEYPDSLMIKNLLAWSLIANNEIEEAKQLLSEILAKDANYQSAYLNFGQAYEKEGNLEKAKDYYRKAYNLSPNSTIGNEAAEKYNNIISGETTE